MVRSRRTTEHAILCARPAKNHLPFQSPLVRAHFLTEKRIWEFYGERMVGAFE